MATTPSTGPGVDPHAILAPLLGSSGILLAVSGGPDSTALMFLAAQWRDAAPSSAPPMLVVCVDHGLRPESPEEAKLVCRNAKALDLAARTVSLDAPVDHSNLQSRARRRRYRALVDAARLAGCDVIVTAHNLDDQAETILMRLMRGSGLFGLGGMAAESRLEEIRLVRPLLSLPKSALMAIAAGSGLAFVDDPSNHHEVYDRVFVRRLIPDLAAEDVSRDQLIRLGTISRDAAELVDRLVDRLLVAEFDVDNAGAVTGARSAFSRVPRPVACRALARVLRAVGGSDYMPCRQKTSALAAAVLGSSDRWRRTLAGATVTAKADTLTFCREWGRQGPPTQGVQAPSTIVWDKRFRFEVEGQGPMEIAGLGRELPSLIGAGFARSRWATSPAVYAGDRLIAVHEDAWSEVKDVPVRKIVANCLVKQALFTHREILSI